MNRWGKSKLLILHKYGFFCRTCVGWFWAYFCQSGAPSEITLGELAEAVGALWTWTRTCADLERAPESTEYLILLTRRKYSRSTGTTDWSITSTGFFWPYLRRSICWYFLIWIKACINYIDFVYLDSLSSRGVTVLRDLEYLQPLSRGRVSSRINFRRTCATQPRYWQTKSMNSQRYGKKKSVLAENQIKVLDGQKVFLLQLTFCLIVLRCHKYASRILYYQRSSRKHQPRISTARLKRLASQRYWHMTSPWQWIQRAAKTTLKKTQYFKSISQICWIVNMLVHHKVLRTHKY